MKNIILSRNIYIYICLLLIVFGITFYFMHSTIPESVTKEFCKLPKDYQLDSIALIKDEQLTAAASKQIDNKKYICKLLIYDKSGRLDRSFVFPSKYHSIHLCGYSAQNNELAITARPSIQNGFGD